MNRVVGGGIILKKDGWLVSICWKTLDELPMVSIRKNNRLFLTTGANALTAKVAVSMED